MGRAKELEKQIEKLGFRAAVSDHDSDYCCIIDISKGLKDAALLEQLSLKPAAVLAIVDADSKASLAAASKIYATHILPAPFDEALLEAKLLAINAWLAGYARCQSRDGGKDRLTGLDKATEAEEKLRHWPRENISAAIVSLRRFEAVNTAFGKETGDGILATVAQRIRTFVHETLGENSLVARIGGCDFLIATHIAMDRYHWQFVTEELLEIISKPIAVRNQAVRVNVKAVLTQMQQGEDAQSFWTRLISILEGNQKKGGSPIAWSNHADAHATNGAYQLESDLMNAIERGQIKVRFQPQFAIGSNVLMGAEALAYWRHHKFGPISASVLFALAERADFTEHLSAHIGTLAMQYAARWPAALPHLRLAVNVTAQELASAEFLKTQMEGLADTGFDAERLTLEITESALIDNLQGASALLTKLRDQAIRIAIDDFGTGYANFLYLKSLPLDYIKLDHAMVRDVAGGMRSRVIVRSIIALAQSLDLEIVAEGVETDRQLAVLQDEGCQYYQGFLKARALSPKEFEKFALAHV